MDGDLSVAGRRGRRPSPQPSGSSSGARTSASSSSSTTSCLPSPLRRNVGGAAAHRRNLAEKESARSGWIASLAAGSITQDPRLALEALRRPAAGASPLARGAHPRATPGHLRRAHRSLGIMPAAKAVMSLLAGNAVHPDSCGHRRDARTRASSITRKASRTWTTDESRKVTRKEA